MRALILGISFIVVSVLSGSAKADNLHIKLIATYYDLGLSQRATDANKLAAFNSLNLKCTSWGGTLDRESVAVLSGNAYSELLAAACLHH